uniref:Zinc knuckle CX2CX4HX4C n=1 Tax=Tanacetum cinerariifolium TaxID=118510 RepID=A0A699J4B4_TANCI|nr:hypothetical protein [Tanacetum cinerariifolium]
MPSIRRMEQGAYGVQGEWGYAGLGINHYAYSYDELVLSSYARAMIELRADVELKDNIVVAMPKTAGEGHYTCNIRVEYEWKPPRCTSCKVFGHIHDECPKNIGAGVTKTMKKPCQTSQGVSKGVEPTIEVSNSNPIDVLNSVDNDVELGTNEGTTNLVNNEANSSGYSFKNIDNSSTGTTPIIDKIRKFEDSLSSGQAILVDNVGNPLKKVEVSGDYDSADVTPPNLQRSGISLWGANS